MSATSAVPSVPGFLDRFLLAPVIWELHSTLLAQVRTAAGANLDHRKQACDFLGKASSAFLSILFWSCVVLSLGVAYLAASRRRASLRDDSTSWYSWVLAATAQQPARNPAPIPDPTPANPKGAGPDGEEQLKCLTDYFLKPSDSKQFIQYSGEEDDSPYGVLFRHIAEVPTNKLEDFIISETTAENMIPSGDGKSRCSEVLNAFCQMLFKSSTRAPYLDSKSNISLKEESNRLRWNALITKLLQLRKAHICDKLFNAVRSNRAGAIINTLTNYDAMYQFTQERIRESIANVFSAHVPGFEERCSKIYALVDLNNTPYGDVHSVNNELARQVIDVFGGLFYSLPEDRDENFDFSALKPDAFSNLRCELVKGGGTGKVFFKKFSFTARNADFDDVEIDGAGEDRQKLKAAVDQMEGILDRVMASAMDALYKWTGVDTGNLPLPEHCNSLAQQWHFGEDYVDYFKQRCERELGKNYPGVSDLATNGECLALALRIRDETRKAFQEPIEL
jgi:hypothetical protein